MRSLLWRLIWMKKKSKEVVQVIRSTPASIAVAIEANSSGLYYYVEDDKYVLCDLRKKSPTIEKFDTIEEIIRAIDKK